MANIYFSGSTHVIRWLDNVPLSPEQKQTLSTIDVAALPTVDMSGDDPWDWDIDRVVKELCTADRTWQPRGTLTVLPTAIDLETKLRDEGIDGCLLLCDVTEEFMKQDLGLTKLAWRVFVKGAFEQLRIRSEKYKQHMLFQHTGSYHTFSNAPAAHQPLQPNQIPPTPPAQPQQHLLVPNNSAATAVQQVLEGDQGLLTSIDSRSARGEFIVSDDQGNKRRKLDLTNTASNLALQNEDDAIFDAQQSDHAETPEAENAIPIPTPASPEITGKKQKRIAPTLVSSVLDPNRNRDIPTAADDVVHNDPQNIEPGVVFRGDDGKKRMIPIHQPDGDSEEPYDYQTLLQKPRTPEALEQGSYKALEAARDIQDEEKKLSESADSQTVGYLGKRKKAVDDIFYSATPVGQEWLPMKDTEDFSVSPRTISSGRRLYMHRVMKKYLNSKRTLLLRDGKYFSAVRPYSSSLTPRPHKPSFTLFYASEDGQIHARREELQLWPEIDPEAQVQKKTDVDGNNVTFNTSMPEILHGIGSYDLLDLDLLEKYNYVEGGDEILPLYGESDEENEYDLETWKEIEEEQGTLNKPMKQLSKPALTTEEVNEFINEGIAETVLKWNKYRLPTNQHKAFKLWKKYRPRLLRADRLQKRKLDVEHLNERIAKLCKEIAEETWTSREKVRKQTRMLEPSIYDREDWTWEIRVIESKQRPERLPPCKAPSDAPSKKSSVRTDDGEEGESIDGRSDASSSDGDLDDFIVDDSPVSEEEKELNLADGEEEEDGTSSDVSMPDLSSKLPTARKLFPKRFSKFVAPGDDDTDDELFADAPETRVPSLSGSTKLRAPLKQREPKDPKLPATTPNTSSGTKMIDLTLSSDDNIMDLVTPKKKTTTIKLINRNSPVNLISDSDDTTQLPDPENLPPLEDTALIARYGHQAWVNLSDRERLLISVLHWIPVRMRNSIFALTSNTKDELWRNMVQVMDTIRKDGDGVKGIDDATFENLCCLIMLFIIFAKCKYYPFRQRPSKAQVPALRYEKDRFSEFYLFCQKIEGYLDSKLPPSAQSILQKLDATPNNDDDDDDEEPSTGQRSRSRAINDFEEPEEDTPHKVKRKKLIFENTEARALREQDRERQAAQEERRKKLLADMAKSGSQGEDSQIIINDSKLDEQGFVYVNQQIARRIKPHQIEGVRFMWNQVVAGGDAKQGCLLAHTMGLGKTMQVITLLVAIAESSSSADESVRNQIPMDLRERKTLILCPPGLIDNWMDELLIWAPTESLGSLRKVDAAFQPKHRWDTIDEWYHNGGVLILGYEMFRNIINNKKRGSLDEAPISEELHSQIIMQLVEGPNIIIADEAHKMKNAVSGLAQTTSLFKSRSRIALTGSPLANNVVEYHTMIEWVAPNYLGPAVEFRAKYVEPIQAGLYYDSTAYERRKSLKMLGVLKEDLSPKVHRADMSVLRKDDLPPKKEFVITVPLTDLQRKAYSTYVKSMSKNVARTKDGDITSATVWSWLAILSLLCNHPDPFMIKLVERKTEVKNGGTNTPVSRESTDHEDIELDLNTSVWRTGVSESLVNDEQNIFAEEESDLKSINLSYKTKILCQILDASKAVGDKVLIFSQSIPTLDFLEEVCLNQGRKYARLDGKTTISKRQGLIKKFNTGSLELYLISTTAGGLGLNLIGANRVVIFDFKFNPILEEQAVGRAYRIGQQKEVFVYRFVAGGTFEDAVHNKAIFKKQLASRVVDKKNPVAWAKKKSGDFLFEPKDVEQQDLSEFKGMDPKVLDKILASQNHSSTIRAIVQTDTFEKDDDDALTAEEQREVKQMLQDEKLKRTNPQAYAAMIAQRHYQAATRHPSTLGVTRPSPDSSAPTRNVHSLPNYTQGAQRSASGPIRPPPRPTSSHSRAASSTLTLTAESHIPSQALPDRIVQRPAITTQTPSTGAPAHRRPAQASPTVLSMAAETATTGPPPQRPSLQAPPDLDVSKASIAADSRHGGGPGHVSQRGSSPVMGAGTKIGSETSESTSPAPTTTRAANVSSETPVGLSKKVNGSVVAAQTPFTGPPSRAPLQASPDLVSRSSIAAVPGHRLGYRRDTRLVVKGGISPVMGAGTKESSETSESTSPATTNTRSAYASLGAAAEPSKMVTESTDFASNAEPVVRSETLKHRNRDMEKGAKIDPDKSKMGSDMFRAMNKRPVQSLRTPVTKPRQRTSIVSPLAAEDDKGLQKVHEKRARRIAQQSSINGTSATSTSSVSITATPGRLPRWAEDNIKGAKGGLPRSGRDSSASSRTTTPKE